MQLREHDILERYVSQYIQAQELPVVNFAAGGVATPADAALMMQLGADGVLLASGVVKAKDKEAVLRDLISNI
jgi:pyridoxal 5'-phosphate synthase pdxS subunit